MRNLIFSLAASLDGYIARADGSVDWLKMQDLTEAGDEMMEFYGSIDTILFGRKTFEKGLEMDPAAGGMFSGFKNYVFSHSPPTKGHEAYEFVTDDAASFVQRIKKEEGKDILLMGGGDLAATFFRAGLIDRLIFSIQPVILGEGIPLFGETIKQTELKLTDVKTRQSGSVQVSYDVLSAHGGD